MSVGLKQSYDVEYNGTVNVARMDLFVDTAADLNGLTTFDNITLLQGSTAEDISTGDKYAMQTNGTWVKQPSQAAFSNVYTKAEIDSMFYLYYTKIEADDLFVWVTFTITTDTMPITFISDGTPLISWSMKGNGVQSGTPTPDNPVMPEFVGARTAQLFDKDNQACYFSNTSLGQGSQWKVIGSGVVLRIPCTPSTAYTISLRGEYTQNVWNVELTSSDDIPTAGYPVSTNVITSTKPSSLKTSFTTLSNTKYILLQLSVAYINSGGNANIMINSGSTALPYEPFGYKIPITCGGETTPVYLGEVPTVRRIKKVVFTGQETWTEVYPEEPEAQAQGIVMYATSLSEIGTDRNDFRCSHFFVGNYRGYLIPGQGRINGTFTSAVPEAFTVNYNNGSGGLQNFKAWLASEYAAGHPVTLWYALATEQTSVVNEPLCKIGDYADELNSTTPIPTVKGSNILTVESELQPSEMTITGKIREVNENEQ